MLDHMDKKNDKNKMINLIMSQYRKLAQNENKTRHAWLGKLIQSQLCKWKCTFEKTN